TESVRARPQTFLLGRLCSDYSSSKAQVFNKADRPIEDKFRLILMRRVAAFMDHTKLGMRHLLLDPVQLGHGPVLILMSLNYQCRAGNRFKLRLYIPITKLLAQPDVVPAFECRVCISVMSGKGALQLTSLVGVPGVTQTGERYLLHKNVRSFKDDG